MAEVKKCLLRGKEREMIEKAKEQTVREIEKEAMRCYNQVAEGYEMPTHETVRNFEAVTSAFLKKELLGRTKPGDLILDLGGGRGYVAEQFERLGGIVTLGDISKGMLKCAMREIGSSLNYALLSAFELPFKDETFDLVLTLLCGAYLRSETVAEVYRVLKPRGLYVVTETPKEWTEASQSQRNVQPDKIWFKDAEGSVVFLPFRYVYYLEELASLLSKFGFEVIIKETLRPGNLIPPESISTVNKNVAKTLGMPVQDIPMLSALVVSKP